MVSTARLLLLLVSGAAVAATDQVAKVADALLVELIPEGEFASAEAIHNKVEKWIEKYGPGHDQSHASKDITCVTSMQVVEAGKVEQWVHHFDLPGAMSDKAQKEVRRTVNSILLTKQKSETFHSIDVKDDAGGTRTMEKFMFRHTQTPEGDVAIMYSYFGDMRTLTSKWKWLVRNHKTEDLLKWLDYKLYRNIKKKAGALLGEKSGSLARLEYQQPKPKQPLDLEHDRVKSCRRELSKALEFHDAAGLEQILTQPKSCDLNDSDVSKLQAYLKEFRSKLQAAVERKSLHDAALEALYNAEVMGDSDTVAKALEQAKRTGVPDSDLKEFEERREMSAKIRRQTERKKAAHAQLCRAVSSSPWDLEEALEKAKVAGLIVDRDGVRKLCQQGFIDASALAPVMLLIPLALVLLLCRRRSAPAGALASAGDASGHEADVKPEDSASQINAAGGQDCGATCSSLSKGSDSSHHWSVLSSPGETSDQRVKAD